MSYSKFFERYIMEMPQRLNGLNSYEPIVNVIKELLKNNADVINLTDNTFKIKTGNSAYYWVGLYNGENIQLCANADEDGKFAKINAIGKHPNLIGKSPYAIDLYLKISDNLPQGVRFTSDQILSDDGFKVWKRIFELGKELLVYKADKFETERIKTISELENYFNDHNNFQQYQYVIAESTITVGIKGDFAIMECKRLAKYPLGELFNVKRTI